MVESALTLPVFLLLLSGCIDFGRYIYIRGSVEASAREAGRQMTVLGNRTSDCAVQQKALSTGNAISVSVDPASVWLNASPLTNPSPGQGLVYVQPAVAQSTTVCTAYSGNVRPTGTVTATVTYAYVPFTPVISAIAPSTIIRAVSTQPTEY